MEVDVIVFEIEIYVHLWFLDAVRFVMWPCRMLLIYVVAMVHRLFASDLGDIHPACGRVGRSMIGSRAGWSTRIVVVNWLPSVTMREDEVGRE